MRKEFTLTDEQLETLLHASRPTPVMYATGGRPMFGSPQENSNRAWQKLAKELGFIWDTVKPIPGKHMRYFTAEDPLFRESML